MVVSIIRRMMFLALIKKGQVIVTKIGMDGKGTPVHVIEHGLIGTVFYKFNFLNQFLTWCMF